MGHGTPGDRGQGGQLEGVGDVVHMTDFGTRLGILMAGPDNSPSNVGEYP